jgi:hypothetical protein
MSKIFIQDNFFEENIYNEIVQKMIAAEYDPPDDFHRKAHKGAYWHTHYIPNDCDVQKLITKLIKEKFYFKITKFLETYYTMVGASDKARPHIDSGNGCTHQCLIYMHGEEVTNNGTGFYHVIDKKTLEVKLNSHASFIKNRAIFFSSDVYHAPLQWQGGGSFRYSICNFFT